MSRQFRRHHQYHTGRDKEPSVYHVLRDTVFPQPQKEPLSVGGITDQSEQEYHPAWKGGRLRPTFPRPPAICSAPAGYMFHGRRLYGRRPWKGHVLYLGEGMPHFREMDYSIETLTPTEVPSALLKPKHLPESRRPCTVEFL